MSVAGLIRERLHQPRMAVAQRADRDAGERVEIALARLVPEPDTLAALEGDRLAGVGVHQM